MAAPSPSTPAPKFQANLNFNAIMSKMEQNVKSISTAFKVKKVEQKPNQSTKMRTYFGDEELLNSIPPDYYKEGFDVLTDMLSKLPTDVDEAYLDKVIAEKEAMLEVLNGRLFNRVMSSYGDFVQGMTQIGELSGNLQQSAIMCKNGRRNLHTVRQQLTGGGLVILAIFRRRQNLSLIIQDMLQIRSLLEFQHILQKLLHVGDYPKTIATCLEARNTVSRCSRYTVVRELDLGLQGVYTNVADRLDKALSEVCRNFTPNNYEGLISAYKMLGSTSRIAERMQSYFMEPIESDTKSIVLAHVLLSPENIVMAESIKKKSFKEACAEVKEEHFHNCLLTTLEFMCDLMFSHYSMSKWHAERIANEDNKGYAEINSAMEKFKKMMWDTMQRQLTTLITPPGLIFFTIEEFVKVVNAVTQFLDIGEEFTGTIAINLRNLVKSQGKLYLETFHRQRAEDLKTMLDNEMWARCIVGEKFSLDEVKEFSEALNAPLPTNSPSSSTSKTPKSMFGTNVSNGNPFSKMIQYEKRKATPGLAAAAAAAAATAAAKNNKIVTTTSNSPGMSRVQSGGMPKTQSGGLTKTASMPKSSSMSKTASGGLAKTSSGGGMSKPSSGGITKPTSGMSRTSQAVQEDEDSDEEPEELRANYVDEDAEGPAMTRSQSAPLRIAVADKGLLLAPTTITVVRLLAKYIHLLRALHKSLGLEIFVAAVQLMEYFVYSIYLLFGAPPPNYGVTQEEVIGSMSPGLRKMLNRFKERYTPPPPVLLSAVGGAVGAVGGAVSTVGGAVGEAVGVTDGSASKTKTGATPTTNVSPHDLVKIKWSLVRLTQPQATDLASPKTGFGLGMRTVGVESLLFLAEALTKARTVLHFMMPPTASEFFAGFYANVGLIPELRMQMYKAGASGLLSLETIPKLVDSVKWDTNQVKVESSPYVDRMLQEFVAFGSRLDRAVTLPIKVKTAVWEAVILRAIEVVVEGYSKIKKCTMEGRANMLQDRGIEQVAPLKNLSQVPGIAHALHYVNAYYLPLEDIPEWAQEHPEFPLRQILALVTINPESSNRAKRQQITTLLEEMDKAKRSKY